MRSIGFTEAFAAYGAKLVNANWAVSSITDDGTFVMSCWSHLFETVAPRGLVYRDALSRWGGGNPLGNDLLRQHLTKAHADKLPVGIVVATAADPAELDTAADASKVKKSFHIRKDWLGRVSLFDGDNFDIEISPKK